MKRFEINIGKGYGPASSELAINGNIFVEMKDLTGAVSCLPCELCIVIFVVTIIICYILLHVVSLLTVQIKVILERGVT